MEIGGGCDEEYGINALAWYGGGTLGEGNDWHLGS